VILSHVCKPSQYLHDIRDGKGAADNCPSKPDFPTGIWAPADVPKADKPADEQGELVGVIGAATMAAEMADAHGLELQTLAEVMCSLAWPQWQEAMNKEHTTLEMHGTWHLEKPPLGVNLVGCHWVFMIKHDVKGTPIRHCARLVV